MKVIKSGLDQGKWVRKFICKECTAVLEVEKSDLYVVNPTSMWE